MSAIAPMERWRTPTLQGSENTRHFHLVRRLKTRHRLEGRKRLGVCIQRLLGHIRQNLLGNTERDRGLCHRGCQGCSLRLRRNDLRTAVVYPDRGNPHGALVVLDAKFAHAQIQAISREPHTGSDNEITRAPTCIEQMGAASGCSPVF